MQLNEPLSEERYIVGALAIAPEITLPTVTGLLTADDFADETCKALYAAAMEIAEAGEAIDPVAMKTKCKIPVTDDYMRNIMSEVPTLQHVAEFAARVADGAESRKLQATLDDSISTLMLGGTPDDVRGKLIDALENTRCGKAGLVTSQDAISKTYNDLQDMSEGKTYCVKTGYADLDKILGGGMRNSGLYYLAARPGGGKTTLALQIAENAATDGIRTLFITLEMSIEQLNEKRIAVDTGLSLDDLHSGKDWKAVNEACKRLYDRPMAFNKLSNLNVSMIERYARQHKAGMIVIDYLGLIQHGEGKSIYEKVTATSNALKRLARTLNVPILCLCQLNRNAADTEPKLSDLRDSGAIEQDGDGVLLLHLPNGRPENDEAPAELSVIVAKNRHGASGVKQDYYWWMGCGRIKPPSKR